MKPIKVVAMQLWVLDRATPKNDKVPTARLSPQLGPRLTKWARLSLLGCQWSSCRGLVIGVASKFVIAATLVRCGITSEGIRIIENLILLYSNGRTSDSVYRSRVIMKLTMCNIESGPVGGLQRTSTNMSAEERLGHSAESI
jgi:hypothetical protein